MSKRERSDGRHPPCHYAPLIHHQVTSSPVTSLALSVDRTNRCTYALFFFSHQLSHRATCVVCVMDFFVRIISVCAAVYLSAVSKI